MLKTILIALALTIPVTAIAGQTSSVTIKPNEVTVTEDCDPTAFYTGLIASGQWSTEGNITNWSYGSTVTEVQAFVSKWNNDILATTDDTAVPGLIITDADQFIALDVPLESTFPDENTGKWVFFYKNGCYLDSYSIKADLPPNPIPAMTVGSTGNSASYNPDSFLRAMKNGT